jgi:sec-independent protein translocase protein TatA
MGSFSLWHWIIVLVVILVLFGRGRVADVMGEFGKGIKSFKSGMNEADDKPATPAPPPAQITNDGAAAPAPTENTTNTTNGQ